MDKKVEFFSITILEKISKRFSIPRYLLTICPHSDIFYIWSLPCTEMTQWETKWEKLFMGAQNKHGFLLNIITT